MTTPIRPTAGGLRRLPGQMNHGGSPLRPISDTQPVSTTSGSPGLTDPNDLTYTEIIKQTRAGWGLSDLYSLVDSLGRTGAGSDEISLRIQQSPEYAQRFAGNAERVKNGLGVLSPAEYIALEGQYKQILSQLPTGFYDDKNSIDGFIGGDVSPAELSDRVAMANQAYVLAPQSARDAWNAYNPGAGDAAHAIASILDTDVAEPLIQQRVAAAGIGGAALGQGLALTSQAKATQAAQQGVTIDQARQVYQQIATRLPSDTSIAGRFGTSFGQGQEEDASLLGNAAALRKQQLLYSEEAAQFSGHGGADATSGNPGANY